MAPLFQDLINKWVNVNKSHYAGGERNLDSSRSKPTRSRESVSRNCHGEERTAVTAASTTLPSVLSTMDSEIHSVEQTSTLQSGLTKSVEMNQSQRGSDPRNPISVYPCSSPIRNPRVKPTILQPPIQTNRQIPVYPNRKVETKNSRKKHRKRASLTRTLSQSDLLKEKFDEKEKEISKQQKPLNRLEYYETATPINTGRFLNTASYSQQLNHHYNHTNLPQHSYARNNNVGNNNSSKNKKSKRDLDNLKHRGRHRSKSKKHINEYEMNPTDKDFIYHHSQQQIHFAHPEQEVMATFHTNKPMSAHQFQQYQNHSPIFLHDDEPPLHTIPGRISPSPSTTISTFSSCQHCSDLEKKIMMMQSDIEYLRSIALNNETVCSACASQGNDEPHLHHSSHNIGKDLSTSHSSSSLNVTVNKKKHHHHTNAHFNNSISGTSGTNATASTVSTTGSSSQASSFILTNNTIVGDMIESQALAEASQRLVDVTIRHKQQIEQMTREKARWQNDMHLKLSKFALLCKELNEESDKRKQDLLSTQAELTDIKDQYAAVSMEVELLRAKVALHEQEVDENEDIRKSLVTRDNELMDKATFAIGKRDKLITELSGKLEVAIDTLELERYQQRQRRQIIFPVTRYQQMQMNDNSINDGNKNNDCNICSMRSFYEQLQKAQDATKVAEESLREETRKATQREDDLQKKCEQLENELRNCRINASNTNI